MHRTANTCLAGNHLPHLLPGAPPLACARRHQQIPREPDMLCGIVASRSSCKLRPLRSEEP